MKDKVIYLSDGVAERLKKAAKSLSVTEMALIREGVNLRLKEVEEEMHKKEQSREDRARKRGATILSSRPSSGMSLHRDSIEPAPATTTAPTPPPPQIVFMQAPPAAVAPSPAPSSKTSTEEISRLASYVAATSDYFEGVKRTQLAVDVIRASTEDALERERLAKLLDDEVRLHKQNRPTTESPLEWFKKVTFGQ